jgi:hypothetical protein
MAGKYMASGAGSGTRMSAMQDLIEQQALGRQGNLRSQYLEGEDLKRQLTQNLYSMLSPMLNMPLNAANVQSGVANQAGQQVQNIQSNYGQMGNALGQIIQGQAAQNSTPTYANPSNAYSTNFDTSNLQLPSTSTNQPAYLGTYSNWTQNMPYPGLGQNTTYPVTKRTTISGSNTGDLVSKWKF